MKACIKNKSFAQYVLGGYFVKKEYIKIYREKQESYNRNNNLFGNRNSNGNSWIFIYG